MAQLYGERLDDFPEYICFPTPQRLAAADPQALKALGMPLKRAEALIHLANAALEGSLPMTIPGDVEQAMKTLQTFPGIGAGMRIISPCAAGRRKMFSPAG